MKNKMSSMKVLNYLFVIGCLFGQVQAGQVTYPDDSYASGDTLTATGLNGKFNELKADVNDNDGRIAVNISDIVAMQAAITSLQSTVTTLQSDLTSANATITSLQTTTGTHTGDITSLQTTAGTHTSNITSLQTTTGTHTSDISSLQTTTGTHTSDISSLQTTTGTHTSDISAINNSSVMDLNPYLTVDTISDARGPLVQLSGINLQLMNGVDSTTVNGLGNLIIGYDTVRATGNSTCSLGTYTDPKTCEAAGETWALSHKTGSHYLVIGNEHNYSQHNGMVVGLHNTASGIYSSVSVGGYNTASGNSSSVSGGVGNTASGNNSSVSGGVGNTASGGSSSISGGDENFASGSSSSISGGNSNFTSGIYSSVSGGVGNTANAIYSSVSGGSSVVISAANGTDLSSEISSINGDINSINGDINAINTSNMMALDPYLSVDTLSDPRGPLVQLSGINLQLMNGVDSTTVNGLGNLIIGYDTVRSTGYYSCSLGNYIDPTACGNSGGTWALSHKSGSHYLVIGNDNNYSQHSGTVIGYHNTASGIYSSVSGGFVSTASGIYSSVSGGYYNTASGDYGSVSGGYHNTASGDYGSVSGGRDNTASGEDSSVSGGWDNTASGNYSSVSGGYGGTASGRYSSVSGGSGNTASGWGSSISGGLDCTTTISLKWVVGGTSSGCSGNAN